MLMTVYGVVLAFIVGLVLYKKLRVISRSFMIAMVSGAVAAAVIVTGFLIYIFGWGAFPSLLRGWFPR